VKGDVEFEMKEIYNRGDMVLSNAHTVCNDLPLESGGELYLGASRNSEPLVLAADKNILIEMPARSNKEMQLFNGMPDRNSVNWNVANPNTVTPVLNSNSITGSSYNFSTSSMNWINCDKFMRSNSSNTKINVRVPKQFDTTNTAVFIVFAGQNTVTKFDHFTNYSQLSNESNQSIFDTRWYTVPVGADVTIVAISEVDGQVFSAIQPTKIMKDQVAELEFNPTTMDEFKSKMSTLP
jgi:outer membrane protein assembly factor BamB